MSRARRFDVAALLLAALALLPAAARAEPSSAEVYAAECAACHGAGRLGGTGPALIPEALVRLKKDAAVATIAKGRAATQMPAFEGKLSGDAIKALVDYVYQPLAGVPNWGQAEIEASRVVTSPAPPLARPVFAADPMNLFVVVEAGDHHVTVLDGDTFTPLTRFASRFALHGGPKFSPDGRFVYFMSRDGWVTKYDLWRLETVAEVRAALNARNIAMSKDGRHLAVANYLPHTLVILSAEDLSVERIFAVADKAGTSSRVSAVYQAPQRNSFIAALKDVPEVWEISYNPKADDVPIGVIHDFLYKEGAFIPGFLNPRRTYLSEPIDDFFFTQSYDELMGASREAGKGQVIHLDVRKKIANLQLPGMPHLAQASPGSTARSPARPSAP